MMMKTNKQNFSASHTILIVEDNDDDFEFLQHALAEAEIKNPIHRCDDGQSALNYLFEEKNNENVHSLGIVLLDLNLPGINGKDTLRAIREHDASKDVPVIILSTSASNDDIQSCYRAGANTYICKPLDMDGFFEAIKRIKEYWFETAMLPKRQPSLM